MFLRPTAASEDAKPLRRPLRTTNTLVTRCPGWATGAGGFQYQFEANPNGTHNEASTENAAFAPQWESHGHSNGDGYTVTMAMPLTSVHGAHAGNWRMQFT
jgi:hypothetical protein